MQQTTKISARLFEEEGTYTISILIHRYTPNTDEYYWSIYKKFRSIEDAVKWYVPRYGAEPLIWVTYPTPIQQSSHLYPTPIPLSDDQNGYQ